MPEQSTIAHSVVIDTSVNDQCFNDSIFNQSAINLDENPQPNDNFDSVKPSIAHKSNKIKKASSVDPVLGESLLNSNLIAPVNYDDPVSVRIANDSSLWDVSVPNNFSEQHYPKSISFFDMSRDVLCHCQYI
jgi:hypothetical protein